MTIFFNLDLLLKKSKNNPTTLVNLLKTYFDEKTNKRYISINFSGRSFLLNPKDLFHSTENDIYKAQYIILAAKRDYFLYRTYGVRSLQLSYFPDLDVEKIKHNPLITISKTDIKLKFEEIQNGT